MGTKNQPANITPLYYSSSDTMFPDLEIFRMSELRARVMPEQLSGSRRYYLYTLMLVTCGGACQTVDDQSIKCVPGSIILIRPGQVHSFGEQHEWDGWLVLFRPEMLPPGPTMPHTIGATGFIHSGVNAALFEATLRQMSADIREGSGKVHKSNLLYHQLASLLIRLDMLTEGHDGMLIEKTQDRQRFMKFSELLEKKFSIWHLVSQYADALSCSSKSLTRATAAFAGRSAKSYISERICLEARRLLTHTTASVSVISQTLGFDEPAHFIKFFKNYVGMSPERFRGSTQPD